MDYKNTNAASTTITYDKTKIEAPTENIYEAITIMAKRAEQISGDLKSELIEKLEEFATYTDSLDEVFRTMGPNPLCMSEELGAQVARSYQHTTTVAKEVGARLGPANTPADQMLNVEMLRMYTKEDPTKVTATVRPVVCRNLS